MSRITRRASSPTELDDDDVANSKPPKTALASFLYYAETLASPLANPQIQSLLAGGTAGIVSRTLVAPIERVKLLLQVQSVSAAGQPARITTIRGSLIDIVRREGYIGLWKGNSSNCIRVFPASALQFWGYGEIKQWLYGGRSS